MPYPQSEHIRCYFLICASHYSLFTIHYSLFTIHYSLFTIHYSLFIDLKTAAQIMEHKTTEGYLQVFRQPHDFETLAHFRRQRQGFNLLREQ